MQTFFIVLTCAVILSSIPLFVMLLRKKSSFYDRFAAVSGITTSTVLFLILIGLADGRTDLYIDIAFSYAILCFVSSIIVAKFMSGRGSQK